MFTVNHFIWLGISAVLIAGSLIWLFKYKPPLEKVLTVACIVSVLSEIVKTVSALQLVPSSNGTTMRLYMEMSHLPLHLCSVQIFLIFFAKFGRESKVKDALLAFMYPSCTIGATFALAIPTVFSTTIKPSQAFTHPIGYQFFIFHSMLIVLGIYIAYAKRQVIKPKHYFSTLGILGALAFASIYLNSVFAEPIYKNGKLISVEDSPNFFFTYRTPIGIKLTEMWHWYVYIAIIAALACVLVALFYLPFFIKDYREKRALNK